MNGGFFEIGIYHTKTVENVGTLWRTAYQLGASGIFTIGKCYPKQASDTVCAYRHVPMREYLTFEDFKLTRPIGGMLVAIEMNGRPLHTLVHPKQAMYLLGAEDSGLPTKVLNECNMVVSLESLRTESYNVAIAGALVMYHRLLTMRLQ